MFWRVMPPALAAVLLLGWLERVWNTPAGIPASARVDTRVADQGPSLGPGDVHVDQVNGPEPSTQPAEPLSASTELLAAVKDEAFFRSEELPAWIQTLLTLRSSDRKALQAAAQPVVFGELFGQPRSFRGRPVRFTGRLRRLEERRAPANDYGFTRYFEAWVEPDDGSSSPIVVHALEVPAGLDPRRVRTPIAVEGYFFKNLAYRATDQLRRAPLVLAATLHVRPPPPPTLVAYHGGWILGYTLLAIAAASVALVVGFGFGLIGPGERHRPVENDSDLEATLAGADIVSPAEALQRLEADHRVTDSHRDAPAVPPA